MHFPFLFIIIIFFYLMSPIMISEKEMSAVRTPFIYLKNYYSFN